MSQILTSPTLIIVPDKDGARYVHVDQDGDEVSQIGHWLQGQRRRHETDLYSSGRRGHYHIIIGCPDMIQIHIGTSD